MKHPIRYKLAFFLFLLFSSTNVFSQVKFTLEAPKFVKQGERFRISFNLNEKPESNISLPNIEGFQVLMGPSISQSSSYQYVNGQMSSSKSYIYSYILFAEKQGKFTIPAVSTSVEGETYTTQPHEIEVLEGNAQMPQQPAKAGQQQQQQNQQRATPSGNKSDNFFVRVHISKSALYPNEHLIATQKLYTRYGGISNVNIDPPTFKGFISKEIPNSQQSEFQQENINGTIYNTVIIGQHVLFPQREGKLVIDGFKAEALAQQRISRGQSIFDDFFGNNVQQFRVDATSPKVTVQVKPLPPNKPLGYNGAVGKFNIATSLNTDSVAVNEAITFKMTIRGNGNLQMLKAPKIEFSPDLEVYDPKVSHNSGITRSGMNGSVTYEYLIIPRHAGTYEIPSTTFSYFDPSTAQYKQQKTDSYTLKVSKGVDTDATPTQAIVNFQNKQQNVADLGNDIKYIKTKRPNLKEKGHLFFNSTYYWLFLLVIPFVFGIILWLGQSYKAQKADTLSNKSKRATKVAIRKLKTAKKSLQNNEKEAFYNHTLVALWGFVSDKLHLPLSELNKENITQLLQAKDVPMELTTQYLKILDTCEMAQYAPVTSVAMDKDYAEAVEIISKLEEKL